MSFPRFSTYKNVGIPWLDQVPAHWAIKPMLAVAAERCETNVGMVESNLLSLSYGRVVEKDITSNDGLLPESFETYQIVSPGDTVFRLTDLQNDQRSLRSGFVRKKGIITSAYVAVQPTAIDPSYFSWLMRAYDVAKAFYSMGGGLRQSMKFSDLKRLPTLLPPLSEQLSISAFIDRETSKIDALIVEQERLIKLLQEKRRAAISHAVTKGLDPSVRMKPSDVEWLGDVPAHWMVSRLKYMTELVVDCPHETPVYDAEGQYFVIRTADIDEGSLSSMEMYRLSEQEYFRRIRRQPLLPGDIVYGREGERWGHAALVPAGESYCLGQRMMQFRADSETDPAFLMWQLNSASTYHQGDVDTVGATSPHVNVETIRNFVLAHPPLNEQRDIAASLEACVGESNQLIEVASEAMKLLGERRSALISAAVTGQIDVRGLVEREAA